MKVVGGICNLVDVLALMEVGVIWFGMLLMVIILGGGTAFGY